MRFALPSVVSGAKEAATLEFVVMAVRGAPETEEAAGWEALKGFIAVGAERDERSPAAVEAPLGIADSD